MKVALCTLALLLVSGMAVPAADLSRNDASFVQSAQHDALGEYALAVLARKKATTPTAKALASKVLADADQANAFIRSFATSHNVKIDNKPGLRADEQYGTIAYASGSSFDQAFANDIHIDASIASSTYQSEAKGGADPQLRAFAKHQLATLSQIASTARTIAK